MVSRKSMTAHGIGGAGPLKCLPAHPGARAGVRPSGIPERAASGPGRWPWGRYRGVERVRRRDRARRTDVRLTGVLRPRGQATRTDRARMAMPCAHAAAALSLDQMGSYMFGSGPMAPMPVRRWTRIAARPAAATSSATMSPGRLRRRSTSRADRTAAAAAARKRSPSPTVAETVSYCPAGRAWTAASTARPAAATRRGPLAPPGWRTDGWGVGRARGPPHGRDRRLPVS